MNKQLRSLLSEQIEQSTHQAFTLIDVQSCDGGCINEAYLLKGATRSYFVKLNDRDVLDTFICESRALSEISATETIRTPQPIAHGTYREQAYLILEALEFGTHTPQSWTCLGEQLAALHRQTQPLFGWQHHNAIGSSPQINTPSPLWADFFSEHRLGVQFALAEQQGLRFKQRDTLLSVVHSKLEQRVCRPSLLHGDLWSGNVSVTTGGEPVIFDPACYYGDREADLAFSELFGGFSPEFYRSYQDAWPLSEGYQERKPIYNLYHILNHANQFGGSYQQQAQAMIHQILA